MIRKPKGPSVLTTKGIVELPLPDKKEEKELIIATLFCNAVSKSNKCNMHVESPQNPPYPDVKCISDNKVLFLELCELVHEKQLNKNNYAPEFENIFKKECNKRFCCPSDVCIEIYNFDVESKLPNIKNSKGLSVIIELIKNIGGNLYLCNNLEPGKWKYYIWKQHNSHFEYRITKLPSIFPKINGIEVSLAGINTINQETHNDLLIKTFEQKNTIKYKSDGSNFIWLLIYSYRHFPLNIQDVAVKRLIERLSNCNCQFNQVWYFWPSPIEDNGILLKLWPEV